MSTSAYNYTLSDLYYPQMAETVSVIHYITFCISSIGFFFISYVILKKSNPEMGFYKYIIWAQCWWSFLLDVLLVSWQPIVIYPFVIAYSKGYFQYFGLINSYLAMA